MLRRDALLRLLAAPPAIAVLPSLAIAAVASGCRSVQYARIMTPGEDGMTGSHQAGQETFCPLVEEAVSKLLGRHAEPPPSLGPEAAAVGAEPLPPPVRRICFVAVENKSAEEIGDFKERIYEIIDARILDSRVFVPVHRRYVDPGLRDSRLRPDQLLVPDTMRAFAAMMESQGQPIDYLLYATLTSGTTRENRDYERSYRLTMELIDVRTGTYDKQSADLVKGYHHSRLSRWRATNPLSR